MLKRMMVITLVILLMLQPVAPVSASSPQYEGASNWAMAELSYADSNNLIPSFMKESEFSFSNEINRVDFCKAIVLFYDKLGGNQNLSTVNPFTDINDPLVTKAYQAGIIFGKSATEFKHLDSLTRQEMCVMIIRALNAIGTTTYTPKTGFQRNYSDVHAIANWALPSVESMNAHKIINGSDDNLDPIGHLTSEQAIIMMYRSYAAFSKESIPQNDQFVIKNGVLTKCLGLGDIVIPNTVQMIDPEVFYDFAGMTSVTIPGSVKEIPEDAFRYCPDLKTITFSEGVTTIGAWSFAQCPSLETVKLPNSIRTIEAGAFNDCYKLSNVKFGEGITSIGESAFRYSNLTNIVLPASLTSIGDSAFYASPILKNVSFLNNNTFIDQYAFEECSTDLTFTCNPDSTASIYARDYGYELSN